MEPSAADSRFSRLPWMRPARWATLRPSFRRGLPCVFALSLTLGGCSMGLFSDATDATVLAQKPYRPENSLCSNLDIRSNEVSVPQFREILACLNSNGSLKEIQALTDLMSDEELLPLVRVGNERFFKNPVYLFQFEKTFAQWVAEGWIERDLDQIGALVRNERWVRSMLALMAKADARLYPALRLVALDLSPASVVEGVEALAALAEAPAFQSIQRQILQSEGAFLDSRAVAKSIASYIRRQREPGRVDVDRRFLKALADGQLFQVFDDFSLSLSPAGDLRETVARLSALSYQLSEREPGVLGIGRKEAAKLHELMRLVHGLHAPIPCLKATQSVPDGVHFILRELSSRSTMESDRFLRRDNLLNLSLMNSFCDYPEALSRHYSALKSLASTDTLFTAVEMGKSFHRNGEAELLVDALGGEGVGAGIHSSLMSPVEELLPILSELSSRGGFEDLLLILSSVRAEDRPRWQQALHFLTVSRPELGGAAIYDVFYDTLAATDEALLGDLLEGFSQFMAEDSDVFAPAMRSLRRAILMNDAHPILDVVLGLLADPNGNQDFFETIFSTARSHPDEFGDALRLVGEMTREEDGRLRGVLSATVRIFSRFAAQGESAGQVSALPVPALDTALMRAHSFSRDDVARITPQLLGEWKGCDALSPTARLDDYESADHEQAYQSYLDCLDADGQHTDLVRDVFGYLGSQKTSTGRSMLHHWIDGLRSIDLGTESIQQAVRAIFDLYDDGTLFRAVDLLPWWLDHDFTGADDSTESGLVSPLLEMIADLVRTEEQSLARLQKLSAELVVEDGAPGALRTARRVVGDVEEAVPFADLQSFPLGAFDSSLWQYECLARPEDRRARAEQLVDDYRSAVNGWNLLGSGAPRRSWALPELESQLLPVAAKLADPSKGPIASKLLDFMKMVSLEEGATPSQGRLRHWSELRDWLVLRSNDWQLIPYFYPGEENPRMKMVTTLDLFELLVINSDFSFILKENYALKFLGLVGTAWGDEPRSLWPADIQAMHGRRSRPQTLREAFEEIKSTQRLAERMIGFPDLPDCPNNRMGQRGFSLFPLDVKARVFNLSQIVSVMERNLPDASGSYRGGMKILRDILYQLWSSTPPSDRGTGDGWSNNLSLGPHLARLGVFRQLARGVRLASLPENQGDARGDELLDHVIEGLVVAATQPDALGMVHALFRQDPSNRFFRSALAGVYSWFEDESMQPNLRESLLHGASVLRSRAVSAALAKSGAILFREHRSEILQVLPLLKGLLSSAEVGSALRGLDRWNPESEDEVSDREDFDGLLAGMIGGSVEGSPAAVDALRVLGSFWEPAQRLRWDQFRERLRVLEESPAYARLDAGELAGRLFEFLGSRDAKAGRLSSDVRRWASRQLSSGDFHEYLLWIERDPEGVRRLLAALGKSSRDGGLKELLRTVRRALPDPR